MVTKFVLGPLASPVGQRTRPVAGWIVMPAGACVVSESGIKTRSDVERLQAAGVRAVLIGETFMRAPDIGAKLRELRGVTIENLAIDGGIRRHKVKDPSFHNWSALALAMQGNQISDFPLCNKSFNLSYAGHDL